MSKDQPGGSSKSNTASSTTGTAKLEITEKLKVLCLHGYRQTGDTFKSKIGSFRKHVSKYADFVFATAPHEVLASVTPEKSTDSENGTTSTVPDNKEIDNMQTSTIIDQRSWWFNSDDEMSFKGTNKSGPAFKFEESLRYIEKIWEEEGPFQGLLGFSQGACFVGILCGLAQKNFTIIKPKFALISAGFLSGSLVHLNFLEDPVTIPSLHVFGETDEIIPKEMSEALADKFENAEIMKHPGGHYFPATSVQKQTYINFFQDRLQEYLEAKELARIREENLITFDEDISCSDDSDSSKTDNESDSDFS